MCAVAEKPQLSPDELLALPDEKRFELIDGELVERNMGVLSGWVAGQILGLLRQHCQGDQLGWTFPSDAGYQCFPDSPRTVRRPDVSFVRKGRFPGEQLPEGWATIAPDLVVEVISPNDLAYEVDEKIQEYRGVGIPLIWIVNPHTRTVLVHHSRGSVAFLREEDELSGEEVIPGFRCPVSAIFPPERPTAPKA
jgi:Uma2 family endonuclease